MFRPLVAVVTGYLAGTVPSADLAAKLAAEANVTPADLRTLGSRNPGAANAIVVLGRGWGYGVMAADIAKGVVACVAGRRLAGGTGAHMAGTAAVIGHCFPVWNGFRGGKGVAASLGQCLMTFPAYIPFDLAVAALVSTRQARSPQRSFVATAVASATWVGSAALWWRRGWPNLWGPPPTAALPIAAAVSSVVILSRFAAAIRRHASPSPPPFVATFGHPSSSPHPLLDHPDANAADAPTNGGGPHS